LLELNPSTYYYKPAIKSTRQIQEEETLKAALDCWHTNMPCLGCRQLAEKLVGEEQVR
jgi:hypothetical protein